MKHADRTYEWSVAVFARNEEARIAKCLHALSNAIGGADCHITIILSGSSDGTASIVKHIAESISADVELFSIPFACKSNAINEFVHKLRPPASYYLFIDATTFVGSNVMAEFKRHLVDRADISAVSGVPANGRGASIMREGAKISPKLFGQMFALKAEALASITTLGRKLPIGLYRGDGLFAGFINHETNGVSHAIPVERTSNVFDAQWTIKPLTYFSGRDIKTAFRRRVRQSRGHLENQAWNTIIWTKGFGALPRFADEMISECLKNNAPENASIPERIFRWFAIREIRRWKRPGEEALVPKLIFRSSSKRQDCPVKSE